MKASMVTVAALFLTGAAVNLYFGRIGYQAFDQSIVFDGAWRMLSGQVPFRDFAAPNAILPAVMQVPFFLLLGVTWFAYCLHASVINGLFSVASYALLRICGATRLEAGLFGALGACFFYPVNGTPFMDQHAFFFTTLMFIAVVVAANAPDPLQRKRAWALVPALFALGYFSKQIPTSFAAVCVAGWVLSRRQRLHESVGPLVAGTAAVLVAVVALALALRMDWRYAYQYLVAMPLDTGAERTMGHGVIGSVRLVLGTLRRMPVLLDSWSAGIAILAMVLMPIGFRLGPRWRVRAWLLWSISLTTAAFVAYTINQAKDGAALAMLAAGLAAVTAREAVERMPVAPVARRWMAGAAVAIVAAAAARDTWRFIVDVDMTRSVLLDTHYVRATADLAEGHLPPALAFMRWTDPGVFTPDELTALVQHLRKAPGDFVLIGDSSLLYGLTGKRSVSPALWLHPGVSMPRPRTAAFDQFESELLGRFEAFDVRRIVVERSLRGVDLTYFPRLLALTESDNCGEAAFGQVRIVELCRAGRHRQ